MFKKILFERTLWQPGGWAGRTTVEIWTMSRLAYFLMSMKALGSEKISLTNMQTLKTVCQRIDKSPVSYDTLTSRLVNGNKHSSNVEDAAINSYWSLWRQLRWTKSLLLTCKVLKLFLNALTGRDKYFLRNRDNLQQPFQMQLSQKQEIFSQFFFQILKAKLNFEGFPIKEERHTWFISEIKDAKKGV